MLKKISIKGVIIGAVTDVVGTNVWGIALVIFLFATHQIQLTTDQFAMQKQIYTLLTSGNIAIISNIVGGGFTVLGGYIAAKIAGRHELINGTLASFLCVVFVLLSGNTHMAWWLWLLALLSNPILGFIGGYLRLLQKKRTEK